MTMENRSDPSRGDPKVRDVSHVNTQTSLERGDALFSRFRIPDSRGPLDAGPAGRNGGAVGQQNHRDSTKEKMQKLEGRHDSPPCAERAQ